MGDGENRDTGPDTLTHAESEDQRMMTALRDARMSSASDARGLVTDTLKRLTINGHGVTGGGLSFAIGNTGLGIDAAVTQRTINLDGPSSPDFLPLRTLELPAPTTPQQSRVQIQPVQAPPIPQSRAATPDDPDPDVNLPSRGFTPPQEGGGIPTVVTGAVNGAPATITLLALDAWAAI